MKLAFLAGLGWTIVVAFLIAGVLAGQADRWDDDLTGIGFLLLFYFMGIGAIVAVYEEAK